jgi:hypothetical protein
MDEGRVTAGYGSGQLGVEWEREAIAYDRLMDGGVPGIQRERRRVEDLAALKILEVGSADLDAFSGTQFSSPLDQTEQSRRRPMLAGG